VTHSLLVAVGVVQGRVAVQEYYDSSRCTMTHRLLVAVGVVQGRAAHAVDYVDVRPRVGQKVAHNIHLATKKNPIVIQVHRWWCKLL
jgi:hypothetical protein